MSMQKIIGFVFIQFVLITILSGQNSNCFENTRALGLQAYNNKHYTRAMDVYLAAYLCPDRPKPGEHDLELLIKQAQEAQLNIYKSQVLFAKQAEEKAINAQKNEVIARRQAEESAEQAQKNGRIAESLRLTLLADIERQRGNYSDALPLAFYAILLSDSTNEKDALTSFSRIVRDSFIQYIPVKGKLIYMQNHDLGIATIDDNGFTLWDENNWHSMLNLPEFNEQFYLDQSVVITGMDTSNTAYLFNIDHIGAPVLLDQHTEHIKWLSSSSNYYLSCSRDNKALLWNKNGDLKTSLIGHKGNVYQGIITKNEEHIITRSSDGSVNIWTIKGELISTIKTGSSYISDMTINEKQELILIGDGNGQLSIWDMEGKNVLLKAHGEKALTNVEFIGNDEERIISLAIDQSLKIWDITGKLITSIPNVEEVKYLASRNILITRHSNAGIKLWSIDGHLISVINDFTGTITAVDFHSNNNSFLTTNSNSFLTLWNNAGQALVEHNIGRSTQNSPAKFSTNGKYFIAYNEEKSQLEVIPHPNYIYKNIQTVFDHSNDISSSVINNYNIQFLND